MSECSVKHLKWGATWPSREQFHELADAGFDYVADEEVDASFDDADDEF